MKLLGILCMILYLEIIRMVPINKFNNEIDLYSTQRATTYYILQGNCVSYVTPNTQTSLTKMGLVNWTSYVLRKLVFIYFFIVNVFTSVVL